MKKLLHVLSAVCSLGSLLYAICVYLVGSGTFSFLIWIAAAIFFLAIFIFTKGDIWQKIPKVFRWLFSIVITICLGVYIVCQVCLISHFGDKGQPDLDYIIVLGAQMRDDRPSVVFKSRLDTAADYLNSNENTVCIVTGGQGSNETISEGDGGRNYLISVGIPEDRILVENQSVDTVQNVRNAWQIITEQSADSDSLTLGVVTNNFHVFRGVHLAERLTDADVCGIASFTEYLYLPNNMTREVFGILRDFILWAPEK